MAISQKPLGQQWGGDMEVINTEKVVSTLPALTSNTVYYVRRGDGFDLYVSDATGQHAHKVNTINVSDRQTIVNGESNLSGIHISTDTIESFKTLNGDAYQSSAIYVKRQGAVDMGAEQASNLVGYGHDYITDKVISNCAIGGNANETDGSVRRIETPNQTQLVEVYLNDAWQTILTGVSIRTTLDDVEVLDFQPWNLSLINGNSSQRALDGTPVVKGMKIDMGAYSSDMVIDGGTF